MQLCDVIGTLQLVTLLLIVRELRNGRPKRW